MRKGMTITAAAAIFFGSIAAAAPSWADTAIKVVEDGEGGGAMSIKLDPPTVKAGPAIFQVKNDAMTEVHEMVVVKLKSPDQVIPFNKAKHRVTEGKLKSMGEVSDLKPGASGTLKVNLKPGTYLLLCNIKGHYEAGMQSKLTVTP
jgi:uncharacterized cupredoxin-like copper-binding protein